MIDSQQQAGDNGHLLHTQVSEWMDAEVSGCGTASVGKGKGHHGCISRSGQQAPKCHQGAACLCPVTLLPLS
jgi:hypothetical protein